MSCSISQGKKNAHTNSVGESITCHSNRLFLLYFLIIHNKPTRLTYHSNRLVLVVVVILSIPHTCRFFSTCHNTTQPYMFDLSFEPSFLLYTTIPFILCVHRFCSTCQGKRNAPTKYITCHSNRLFLLYTTTIHHIHIYTCYH